MNWGYVTCRSLHALTGNVVGDHAVASGMDEEQTTSHAGHDMASHTMPGHDMSAMAVSATLHCLTGCSIGEIAGQLIGAARHWDNASTTALAVVLAFVFGYALSASPLIRSGLKPAAALSLVLAADTVSILTMEIVDNAVMLLVPGAMNAGLADVLFWISMALALAVAFGAALPVNRYLLRRGKGHAVTHAALGDGVSMDNRPLAYAIGAFLLGGATAALGSLIGR